LSDLFSHEKSDILIRSEKIRRIDKNFFMCLFPFLFKSKN